MHVWNQRRKGEPEFTDRVVPVGGTVKIVMASRFGDVGLTDDLKAEHGYHIRVDLNNLDKMFENPRNKP